jgi:hypothetical protein
MTKNHVQAESGADGRRQLAACPRFNAEATPLTAASHKATDLIEIHLFERTTVASLPGIVRGCQVQSVMRREGKNLGFVGRTPIASASQQETITTMQNPLSCRASLETVPLEILNHIFFLTCSEDLDLSLLHISHGLTGKLMDHPIVRIIRAFWPVDQHPHNFGQLLPNLVPMPPGHAPLCGLDCNSDERQRIREEVLASAWCTPTFIRKMQVAFTRRMVKEIWDPFLERDGMMKCAKSHPHFWALLDRVAHGGLQAEEDNMEICLTDNETRYSWTRLRIWPWQGRIVIRDQLLNRSFEKTVPFLQDMLGDRRLVEREVSQSIAA